MGGDPAEEAAEDEKTISIRTPAWGVTSGAPITGTNEFISIRTPAWGVTGIGVINRLIHVYFNSHPRVGGD